MLLTSFRDHHHHKNPHRWLARCALLTFWLRPVAMSELDLRRMSKMQFQTQTSSHQYGAAKPVLRQGLRGCQCSSPTFLRDLQHIHHPRSNLGCGMPLPLSIVIIRKGKTMVLFQQGGSVNLREMLQCISRQVFSIGQDQCPSEKDLYLLTTHR
jgi:hypothetical protein